MEKILYVVLFFTGVLLAACTRMAAPAPAAPAAAARPAAIQTADREAGYCYLALDEEQNFVLHYVSGATRQDTPVARASGSLGADGSRTVRFCWAGRQVTGQKAADGRLTAAQTRAA